MPETPPPATSSPTASQPEELDTMGGRMDLLGDLAGNTYEVNASGKIVPLDSHGSEPASKE